MSPIDAEIIERKLAWQHGMLEFVNATLGEVIADVGRYTDKRLEIVDPELKEYPVTVVASTDTLSVTPVSEDRVVISSACP